MKHPTLYKRTKTGAVQIWYLEANAAGDGYRTVSGQKDGALTTSAWTIATPKNVGKVNESSPQDQAQAEIAAEYVKKQNQGRYWPNESDIDKPVYFEPMLAKKYEEYPPTPAQYAAGLVFEQPKLDGICCIIRADGMWSRQGKPIKGAPHIFEALEPWFRIVGDDLVTHGELYNHELKDDFNKIVSLVKKVKPTKAELEESAEKVQYWMYDYPTAPGTFSERIADLFEDFSRSYGAEHRGRKLPLIITETMPVSDQEMLDRRYGEHLDDGFEGQIVRIDGMPYENKRSKQVLKRKEWVDSEFPIVEIQEGVGNASGMAAKVVFSLSDGRTFKANMMGTREHKRAILAEKKQLVGKEATVKYLNQLTPDGIPRHGRVKIIHETERM